jgi:drug/metabolite transporter (DMT)-like permease
MPRPPCRACATLGHRIDRPAATTATRTLAPASSSGAWATRGRSSKGYVAASDARRDGSYSGVVLVFGHQLSLDGTAVAWGALLVFLSTISYALYMSYSGELVHRLGALRLAGLATSVACLLCIAQFALLRPLAAAEVAPAVLWLSLLNATACTALPVLLVMMAIERIGPALTAQTGMIGPMSTILMGVVILGEPLNSWIIAGTVLVITGIYVFSRSARQA